MSDRETELLDRWTAERPVYDAWGRFVASELTSLVAKAIEPNRVEMFFRIPIKPRTKEPSSLLAKAFHRGKPYANPFDDIEDKVGVRIVVLFSRDIRIVEEAIRRCEYWNANKARDFEEERARKPFEFDYQSLHYIVRSRTPLKYDDIHIAANMPCEVQVRTILQHAYSELTHDTIYKPNVQARPEVKRAAAKSMALIEATDDFFTQVQDWLLLAEEPTTRLTGTLERMYKEIVQLPPDPSPLNVIMIDHYRRFIREGYEDAFNKFFLAKPYLAQRVRERAPRELLYRQPGVLLLYWAVSQNPRGAAEDGPLSHAELEPLYSDLGERLP